MPKTLYAIRFYPELIAAVDKARGTQPRTQWLEEAIRERLGQSAPKAPKPVKAAPKQSELDGYVPCEEHPDAGVRWNDRIGGVAVCGFCNLRVKAAKDA